VVRELPVYKLSGVTVKVIVAPAGKTAAKSIAPTTLLETLTDFIWFYLSLWRVNSSVLRAIV
jgi:hypothetical protein